MKFKSLIALNLIKTKKTDFRKGLIIHTLFISILFNHLPSTTISQTYHPFPTNNIIWIEESGGFECSDYRQQHKIDGDTTISGITYRKLQTNGYYPFNYNSYYSGCFRNDSINKKVYYVRPFETEETLLYDFDLSIGDTLPQNEVLLFEDMYVTDIDSILIAGVYHKRFILGDCDWLPPFLIEGIGSSSGLLSPMYCPFECITSLECVYIEDENVYSSSSGWPCAPLDIETKNVERNVSLVPNPTEGEFLIQASDHVRRFEIYNLNGQCLMSAECQSHVPKISISHLPNGLYSIRLFFDDATTQNLLIIKN